MSETTDREFYSVGARWLEWGKSVYTGIAAARKILDGAPYQPCDYGGACGFIDRAIELDRGKTLCQ